MKFKDLPSKHISAIEFAIDNMPSSIWIEQLIRAFDVLDSFQIRSIPKRSLKRP